MNEVPLKELLRRMTQFDELTILELLDLDSHKLVRLLKDEIADQYEALLNKIDDEEDEEDA